MVTKARADIDVNANERGSVQSLNRLSAGFSQFIITANQGVELLGRGLQAAQRAYAELAQFVSEAVDLANAQELAERRLATALQLRGQFTDETNQGLRDFASELQAVTVVGDEVTLALQAQLLALGVTTEELREATRASIGLSSALGVDLQSAGRLVARVLQGDISALTRYGIRAASVTDAMRQLSSLFALAQAEAETFGGRVRQLSNAWGDFLETIGRVFTQSDLLNDAVRILRESVEDLNVAVAESEIAQEGFDDAVRSLLDALPALVTVGERTTQWLRLFLIPLNFSVVLLSAFADVLARIVNILPGVNLDGLIDDLDRLTRFSFDRLLGTVDDFDRISEGAESARAAIAAFRGELESVEGLFGAGQGVFRPGREDLGLTEFFQGTGELLRRPEQEDAAGAPPRGRGPSERDLQESLTFIGAGDLELFRERVEAEAELQAEREDRLREFTRLNQEQQEILREAFAASADAMEANVERQNQAMASFAAATITNFAAIIGSSDSLGDALRRAVGGTIQQFGQLLIQAGTVALIGGNVSTVAPFLVGLLGGPAATAAGIAAIAAGTAMVALGGSLGGGGGGSSRVPAGTAAGGRPSRVAPPDAEPGLQLGGQQLTIVTNINAPIVGNDRRGGRLLSQILGARALPSGAGF